MIKFFTFFLALFPSLLTAVQLPEASPVPGGIISIAIADASEKPPNVFFNDKRVLVVKNNHLWFAVVGISLSEKPGNHQITLKSDGHTEPANRVCCTKPKTIQHNTLL